MNSFLNKRIPTILGLLLLVIGVLATSYLVNTGIIYFGHAAPTDNPQDVRITNITDTTFTVTYKTEAQVIGTLLLNTNGQEETILDDRDQASGVPKLYTVHRLSVKNAKPRTTYSFTITSGTTTYQNNTQPFHAETGSVITATPSAVAPLSGKVLDENGNIPKEALVLVTTTNGQSLSVLTRSDGTYTIPLNAMRDKSLSSYISLDSKIVLQLLLTDGPQSSQVQVLLGGANPVPLITLSNNYNFVSGIAPIASTAASFGFPPFPTNNVLGATPLIITPQKDEGFTDSQPQFSGKGLPNQSVQIQIHSSNAITATVTTDGLGNWAYRPTTPLSPGQHTLTITTKNADGILQTIEQSFVVYAAGSQVTQSATPSATVTPTATPTPTATLIPTQAITPTPIVTTAPTIITPTSTIAPITNKPKPTLPPTGSNALIYSSVLGIVMTLTGVVLFVLTKGTII